MSGLPFFDGNPKPYVKFFRREKPEGHEVLDNKVLTPTYAAHGAGCAEGHHDI
jgi:hypothetical protein